MKAYRDFAKLSTTTDKTVLIYKSVNSASPIFN